MNKQNYNLAWQIACWSTLGVAVFILLYVATKSGVFSLLAALGLGGIAAGLMMAAIEVQKAGKTIATPFKAAATTAIIAAGLYFIGSILFMTISGRSLVFGNGLTMLIFVGLLSIAAGVFCFMFSGQFGNVFKELTGMSLIKPGILVFAIGIAVAGLGSFIFGIAPGLGTSTIFEIFFYLGNIAALAGSIMWFVGMFQAVTASNK